MTNLTYADLIWNRACFDEAVSPLAGDCALADLLKLHGLAMNGGVLHALECLHPDEVAAAKSGYRFYAFDDVAEFLESTNSRKNRTGDELSAFEAETNRRYAELIPRDSVLSDRFEAYLKDNPHEFAPL